MSINIVSNIVKKTFLKKDLDMVKKDGMNLKNVKHQTNDVCLEAIKSNWRALQFVINPTFEMYMEAVITDIKALEYVDKNSLEDVYHEMVHRDILALNLVPTSYISVYSRHLSNYPTLFDIFKFDDRLLEEIIKKDFTLIQYVKNPSDDLLFKVISIVPQALNFINVPIPDNKSLETERAVENIDAYITLNPEYLKQDPLSIRYVENKTLEMFNYCFNSNFRSIQYFDNLNNSEYIKAFNKYPMALKYIKNPSEKLIEEFIFQRERHSEIKHSCELDELSLYREEIITLNSMFLPKIYQGITDDNYGDLKVYKIFKGRIAYVSKYQPKFFTDSLKTKILMIVPSLFNEINLDSADSILDLLKINDISLDIATILQEKNPEYIIKLVKDNLNILRFLGPPIKKAIAKDIVLFNTDSLIMFSDEEIDFINEIKEFKISNAINLTAYRAFGNWFIFIDNKIKGYKVSEFPYNSFNHLNKDDKLLAIDFIESLI